MQLFHGSQSPKKPSGVLTHFGSMLASAQRIESVFATQNAAYYSGGESMVMIDFQGVPTAEKKVKDLVHDFVEHAQKTRISEFSLKTSAPLRLNDFWEDDPIGSGGFQIISEDNELSDKQKKELENIFGPFSTAIFYDHINLFLKPDEVKSILQQGRSNIIFGSELEKRKTRSIALGKDFKEVVGYEAVWIDLTLKLRKWALSNNFDSFVYQNLGEGNGEDAYVTLSSNQVSKPLQVLEFDGDRYLDAVLPDIIPHMQGNHKEAKSNHDSVMVQNDVFWAGHDPLSFWNPA